MSKLLYTFFFGYAALKWRRLIRTIFLIIAAFVLFAEQDRISTADNIRQYKNQKQDKLHQEALQDAYTLFKREGYGDSIEEFQPLLNTNREALKDAYGLFTQSGYKKSIVEFEKLMGVNAEPVKKKDEPVLDSDSEADSDYIATVKSAILFSILVF